MMKDDDRTADAPHALPALEHDDELALQSLLAPPEMDDAGWDRLHDAVVQAAAPQLAARAGENPIPSAPQLAARAGDARIPAATNARRRAAVRWLRPLMPLAAAAALLIVFVQREGATPLDFTEEALLAEMSDSEFRRLVSGSAEAASLLLLAVQDENGERN
jgi:hypothetical protein